MKTGRFPKGLFAAAVIIFWSLAAQGAEVMVTVNNGSSGHRFGTAVSVSGDWAIIGAYQDDDMGADAGAAYLFAYQNGVWAQNAKLVAGDGRPHDYFGYSVAISGEWAIVGAYNVGFGKGAAYVFRHDSGVWRQAAQLTAADGNAPDYFGYSVAIDGNHALVGAYRDNPKGTESGAVYLFSNQSGAWTQQAKWIPSDGASGDQFGRSLALSETWASVGAMHRGGKGAVYMYQNTGTAWVQRSILLPADAQENGCFGVSVGVSGEWAMVGACGMDRSGKTDAGAVYLFNYDGSAWRQSGGSLSSPSGASYEFFGRSVALSGDYALIGADGTDAAVGAGHLYRNLGGVWTHMERLAASNGASGDRFGWPVALTHTGSASYHAVAGLRGNSSRAQTGGAVYIYGGTLVPEIDVIPTDLTIIKPPVSAMASQVRDASDPPGDGSLGLIVPETIRAYWKNRERPSRKPYADSLPESKDWSPYDSPVKDQGNCGSCAVFSAVALVENLGNRVGLPVFQDLSEQAVLSCGTVRCSSGGWYMDVLEYIRKEGAPPEACFPYTASDNLCRNACSFPEFYERVYDVTAVLWGDNPDLDDLRSGLQNGPLCVAMLVPKDGSLYRYAGGVYNYAGQTLSWQTDGGRAHGVLLVGYDDAGGWFKVKNSWGSSWGEKGYFRIAYDDVEALQFGSYACTASGAYLEGETSTVAITNHGSAPLTIYGVAPSASWMVVSPTAGATLAPNATRVVTVKVNWNLVANDSETGYLTVSSNDSDEGQASVSVTAKTGVGGVHDEAGHIDTSYGKTLEDAILALQVLAGDPSSAGKIRPDYKDSKADVNGDERVGFEEALFILQWLAESR